MSRADTFWLIAVLIGTAHTHTRAEDGPPPVNSTRSVSAGADDDIITHGDTDAAEPGHAAGTYTGVVPGSATPPPAAVPAGKGPATITWPGFQMRPDGTSRVFIQSTAPLEPQPTAAAGKYALHLPGAHISGGTNRLPLDTRYFNTPVTKVSLSADHGGATLVLELRADVTPSISTERGSTGYYFTYIELPRGSYVPNAGKPAVDARAQPVPANAEATKHVGGPKQVTKHLEGDVSDQADARMDNELPPSIKAHGGIKLHN